MSFIKRYILIFFFGILLFQSNCIAQNETPTDDLGNVSDAFQENFFEALKQKGIQNYELALRALDNAEKAAKNNPEYLPVINFEKGKNLTMLRRYDEAENYLLKALEGNTNELDIMEALYDVYHDQNDFNSLIPLTIKMIAIEEDYKEDLANLYFQTKQYDKAITLLEELDILWGRSLKRDSLKSEIYKKTGNSDKEIESIESKIDNNEKSENDYLKLIFLYSDKGNVDKAFNLAKELIKEFPQSTKVHLSLYKFYLEEGNTTEAINSMKTVFKSSIKSKSKYKVLSDFITFVNANPQHEKDLEEAADLFKDGNNSDLFKSIGDYFFKKNKKEQALTFYEKGLEKDAKNYQLIKSTLLLQIELENYNEASNLSVKSLEIFPAKALLYLINGVANNGLNNSEFAIENLEIGLDFLLDDPKMEQDFYQQLSFAYQAIGNGKKADFYKKKASELSDSN